MSICKYVTSANAFVPLPSLGDPPQSWVNRQASIPQWEISHTHTFDSLFS